MPASGQSAHLPHRDGAEEEQHEGHCQPGAAAEIVSAVRDHKRDHGRLIDDASACDSVDDVPRMPMSLAAFLFGRARTTSARSVTGMRITFAGVTAEEKAGPKPAVRELLEGRRENMSGAEPGMSGPT